MKKIFLNSIIIIYANLYLLYFHAPIRFTDWLIFMIVIFFLVILPYDIIRWLFWGKRNYEKNKNIHIPNDNLANKQIKNMFFPKYDGIKEPYTPVTTTAVSSILNDLDIEKEKIISHEYHFNHTIHIDDYDDLFSDAGRLIIEQNKASIGMLQRVFKIGFNRAAHIVDQLCEAGVVGEDEGTKPRKVLVNLEEFECLLCAMVDASRKKDFITNTCGDIDETFVSKYGLTYTDTVLQKDNIDILSGIQFECFCADLLSKNGFLNVTTTQGSGDHGIDILAEKDDVSYAIQCKCYSGNIGNSAIQQALAGKNFYKKDIAVVLTNQYFTHQAKEEAEVFGVKLWDRDKLTDLIQKQN